MDVIMPKMYKITTKELIERTNKKLCVKCLEHTDLTTRYRNMNISVCKNHKNQLEHDRKINNIAVKRCHNRYPNKQSEKMKKYKKEHAEAIKKYHHQYYEEHKATIKKQQEEYKKKHRDEILEYRRQYDRKKRDERKGGDNE